MSSSIEDRIGRLEDQIRNAKGHVEFGRAAIEYYKELLEKHRAEGRDTRPVEALLETFERSQKVFENDLAQLKRRRG